MCTLDLCHAAAFLRIHPVTLKVKAAAGLIPGARIGRRWVFVEADLLAHVRAQYGRRALQGDNLEKSICHFSNAVTPHIGGSNSATTDARYNAVLGLRTKRGPRSITTS